MCFSVFCSQIHFGCEGERSGRRRGGGRSQGTYAASSFVHTSHRNSFFHAHEPYRVLIYVMFLSLSFFHKSLEEKKAERILEGYSTGHAVLVVLSIWGSCVIIYVGLMFTHTQLHYHCFYQMTHTEPWTGTRGLFRATLCFMLILFYKHMSWKGITVC
jgi:hypothetical protein